MVAKSLTPAPSPRPNKAPKSIFFPCSLKPFSDLPTEAALFSQESLNTWVVILLLLLLLSRFSRVQLCATPYMAAHQAPLSLGFSRQEHWSGLPFPSPMHESEKWKWSRSVVSYPQRPHGLQPSKLFCPWDLPGKSTGVGCHCLTSALMHMWHHQSWHLNQIWGWSG